MNEPTPSKSLIERLRTSGDYGSAPYVNDPDLLTEAADEIERLNKHAAAREELWVVGESIVAENASLKRELENARKLLVERAPRHEN